MNAVDELLKSETPLLLDGAMGTMLMAAGLESGTSPELWNITQPQKIRSIHRAYIEAGARVILTNSFGGTSIRLEARGLGARTRELNKAAAALARLEADAAPHKVLVAGSMGPTGEMLAPLGSLQPDTAAAAFAEQAAGLAAGGADLLWIETMSDLAEVQAALNGVRQGAPGLPIAVTMTFEKRGRTMMGVTPQQAAAVLKEAEVRIIGANCGTGPDGVENMVTALHEAYPEAIIIAKANAGLPHLHGTELVYDGTPEVMAGYAQRAHQLGASLIGACCGSTPDHIRAMGEALKLTH